MRREYTGGDVIGARCRAKHAMDPETTRRLLAAWRTRVSDLLALLDDGAFFFLLRNFVSKAVGVAGVGRAMRGGVQAKTAPRTSEVLARDFVVALAIKDEG